MPAKMDDSDVFRPEWLAFEEELGFRPLLSGPSYEDIVKQNTSNALALMDKYAFPTPNPSVQVSENRTKDGLRLKIYVPPNAQSTCTQPVVLYMHGGGWSLGSADEDDYFVCRYARDTGLVFVSCDYRLAPHHPYPDGFKDCVEAAKWCVENAKSLKQKSKVLLMGVSAGATLALATALKMCHDHRTGELDGIVAIQPNTIHPDFVPREFKDLYQSYQQHDTNTVDTTAAMKTFLDIHGAPKYDPYMFPVLNTHLRDLPCVYLSAAETDTLRDDSRILKRLLDRHGVPNKYHEFEKLPHFFFAYPSRHLDKIREEYFAKTAAGIAFVLDSAVVTPIPLS